MPSVLNQEVEILGRVFHFQTELTTQAEATIRTEVFVDGRIVATRESLVRNVPTPGIELEDATSRLGRQHRQIVRGFIERALDYQQRVSAGELPRAHPEHAMSVVAEQVPTKSPIQRVPEPPSREAARAASSSIRLRRILGRFHRRLTEADDDRAGAPERHIELAESALKWLLHSETFQDMRVDEQVRSHLLEQQLEQWLEGERDPAQARSLWSKVRAFDDYLAEINRRAELVAFDQQLVDWVLHELDRRAMTDDVLQRVALLYGRDSGLDALLDQAGAVSTEEWIARLQRVQAHISEPEPHPQPRNLFRSPASKKDSSASPAPAV